MKFISLALILISTASFAESITNKPELARFEFNCLGSSNTAQSHVNAELQGAISVFNPIQIGQLQLGSIGVFNFVADFQFDLNQSNNGTVTFTFQNNKGFVLSQKSFKLPKENPVEITIDYFGTTSSANVHCLVNPASIN